MTKRTNQRTRIPDDWEPDESGRAFADARGVPETEVEAFRDHHLAHGNLMASWSAAWRTWCRNAVRFGTATGRPLTPPLILAFDQADEYGAEAWILTRRYDNETIFGAPVKAIGGYDAVGVARDCCQAMGLDPSERPDLTIVGQWLEAELDPEVICDVIRQRMKPGIRSLRYFDAAIRERGRRAA